MMIFRYLTLSFVVFIPGHVLGANADKRALMASCDQLFKRDNMKKQCCIPINKIEIKNKKEHIKCMDNDDDTFSCKEAECILKAEDIWDEKNKELSEKKARQKMDAYEKKHKEAKPALEKLKFRCLDGKYKKLPGDSCGALKYSACFYLSAVTTCTEWKDGDKCKKISKHASNCNKSWDKHGLLKKYV